MNSFLVISGIISFWSCVDIYSDSSLVGISWDILFNRQIESNTLKYHFIPPIQGVYESFAMIPPCFCNILYGSISTVFKVCHNPLWVVLPQEDIVFC